MSCNEQIWNNKLEMFFKCILVVALYKNSKEVPFEFSPKLFKEQYVKGSHF
ncbi:hypothetical protein SRCM100730_00094 [Bacillus velezensis]|uniref:Uncharacterized protein n=1 Tax=Bacillus velezensis TaxID=492670 RepID=A0A7W4LVN9_BACVE|nr:hypothetical protein SRCM100731_00731 [Bacillus velezensis]OCB99955.1 hypothetical protein SRCM100730_00094 [Bacillus velezensis]QOY26867.1 hypothetical protein BACVE_001878 [Bacillus velezensis]